MTILVIGTVRLPPDAIDRARPAMETMVAASRAEDGCLEYAYSHDLLEPGLVRVTEAWRDRAALARWVGEHGWETVLNRAGTTFRALPEADRQGLDADKAIALMLAQPSMIKRPVLDLGEQTIVGFKPEIYAAALKPAA